MVRVELNDVKKWIKDNPGKFKILVALPLVLLLVLAIVRYWFPDKLGIIPVIGDAKIIWVYWFIFFWDILLIELGCWLLLRIPGSFMFSSQTNSYYVFFSSVIAGIVGAAVITLKDRNYPSILGDSFASFINSVIWFCLISLMYIAIIFLIYGFALLALSTIADTTKTDGLEDRIKELDSD